MTRFQNSIIEKSDAIDACMPSLPLMPTPTLAALIIPTSFPPSPMQHTILLYLVFSISATSAFYLGDNLHITTDSSSITAEKNSHLSS